MKIYTVKNLKVHSLEVRETKKMFMSKERTSAFGYLTRFFKEDGWATSELEAISEALEKKVSRLESLLEKADKARADVAVLAKMEDDAT